MKILDIIPGTSVDGPGLRTSIYFAGCLHHCQGCHNPQSWDFNNGVEMSCDEILNIVVRNDFNVTFKGCDPIYIASELTPLAKKIKSKGYTIWLYTGFQFEDLINNPEARNLLENIDVVVDGPYIDSQRNINLLFRGSSNQRIINVKRSLASPMNPPIEEILDSQIRFT